MKSLLVLSMLLASSAQAYQFSYQYAEANVFRSAESVKLETEKYAEALNASLLRPRGMEIKNIQVVKNITHQVSGEVVSQCTVSVKYYELVGLSVSVSKDLLMAAGLFYIPSQNSVLIPICQ